MGVLQIDIPAEKVERLKNYAKQRGISLNKLFDEMATILCRISMPAIGTNKGRSREIPGGAGNFWKK